MRQGVYVGKGEYEGNKKSDLACKDLCKTDEASEWEKCHTN